MKKILIILSFMALMSCRNEPIEETVVGNDVVVQLLFEKDGCKVYSFHDGGRIVYYSDCRGSIGYETRSTSGKSAHTTKVETLNN